MALPVEAQARSDVPPGLEPAFGAPEPREGSSGLDVAAAGRKQRGLRQPLAQDLARGAVGTAAAPPARAAWAAVVAVLMARCC